MEKDEEGLKPLKYLSLEWWKLYFRCLYGKGYADNAILGAVDTASSTRTAVWTIGGPLISAKYPLILPFIKLVWGKICSVAVAVALVARDLVSSLWHSFF